MRCSVSSYASKEALTDAELAAFEHIGDIEEAPVLDLGMGGGRTVTALRKFSKNYTGLDYVEEMVEECQQKFPGVCFEKGDARDLSKFPDNCFSTVLFSMNGISMVDHQGRMQILTEVHRVLSPGGTFLFSTYNQENKAYRALFQFPEFNRTKNPIRMGVRVLKYSRILFLMAYNRYRLKKFEFYSDEYAIVNDKCHHYATMLYYISKPKQLEQLDSVGFDSSRVLAYDLAGKKIVNNTLDDSIFYVAVKDELEET